MSGQDKFVSRWSRRKHEARIADDAPDAVDVPEVAEQAADEPEKTDAEVLADLGLKDPDELGPGDDFSAFMNSAVPVRLRNRALRKLWLSNPTLANLDALVDYGEDYTDAATVVENLATAYKVGKGYIDKLAADDAASPDVAQAPPTDPEPPEEEDEPEPAAAPIPPEPEAPPPARQRMAFRFGDS